MYVCMCTGVTSDQIQTLLKDGEVQTSQDIEHQTGAGSGCGCCKSTVDQMVEEFHLENKGVAQDLPLIPIASLEVIASPQPISPLLLRQTKEAAQVSPPPKKSLSHP